jgi:PPOX class probable F420-dependent enzyme
VSERSDREAFLHEAHVGVLATVGPGRRPHAAPIWYLYEDGVFVMSVGRGSQKHRNVEREGQATLAVDRRTLPYYAVMVHGPAEIGPPLTPEERLRIAVRYLGEEPGREYAARTADSDSVTIRLRPHRFAEFLGDAERPE